MHSFNTLGTFRSQLRYLQTQSAVLRLVYLGIAASNGNNGWTAHDDTKYLPYYCLLGIATTSFTQKLPKLLMYVVASLRKACCNLNGLPSTEPSIWMTLTTIRCWQSNTMLCQVYTQVLAS